MSTCQDPIELDLVIDYVMGEVDDEVGDAIERHYFACDDCTRRVQTIQDLRDEVHVAVRKGLVTAAVSDGFVRRIEALGLGVRSYVIAPGESVACTIAPHEDFVAVRLRLGANVGAFDVSVEFEDLESGGSARIDRRSLVVDPTTEEVIMLFSGDEVRSFPRSRWTMHVGARSDASTWGPPIGPFVMRHTPWDQLDPNDPRI